MDQPCAQPAEGCGSSSAVTVHSSSPACTSATIVGDKLSDAVIIHVIHKGVTTEIRRSSNDLKQLLDHLHSRYPALPTVESAWSSFNGSHGAAEPPDMNVEAAFHSFESFRGEESQPVDATAAPGLP